MKVALLFNCLIWLLSEACGRKLIPRRLLYRDNGILKVGISGDGHWFSYVARDKQTFKLFCIEWPHETSDRIVGEEGGRIDDYWWMSDSRTILYTQVLSNYQNLELRAMDMQSGLYRTLTSISEIGSFRIMSHSHLVPDTVIIGVNSGINCHPDIYKLNIRTGSKVLMFKNKLYEDFWFDKQLRIRLARNYTDQASSRFFLLQPTADGSSYTAKLHKEVDADELWMTKPLSFSEDGKTLYWLSSERQDLAMLIAENLETGETRVLYRPQKADVMEVLLHPTSGTPLLAYETYSAAEIHPLLPDVAESYKRVKSYFPKDAIIYVNSISVDLQWWVVSVYNDHSPLSYYTCDVRNKTKTCKRFFRTRKKLFKYKRSFAKAVEVKTRDGLTEMCFFTFPRDSIDSTGFPRYPLPTVVYAQGCSLDPVSYKFDNDAQLLANRGYAVIQCNFRGSRGYGKKFFSAANGERGRKMQYDLLDALDWAIARNYTLRNKVAVFGMGYGGYAALAGLTFTPDVFACGMSIVGASNLISIFDSLSDQCKAMHSSLVHRIGGSPTTKEGLEFLKQRSPLFHAERIKKPLFLAQGEYDPTVRKNESEQIVENLRRRHVPVTFMLYPDVASPFYSYENIIVLWSYLEQFLKECLGGSAEPQHSANLNCNVNVSSWK
ncbi:unnamed protein product [Soboliphyme baturini]|uniref:Peptidase_S9 domain-containing protein n=1 Tax=Soboliphyme baturini TaxID=241478 RepID=A0A183J2S2_9BILA|nr:unnamed protein product [Soboliphyme baturini]